MTQSTHRVKLFDDLIKEFAPGFFIKPLQGEQLAPGQIRLDVRENEQAFTVLAEVPCVPKDQIDVSIDGSVVTLRAEVKPQPGPGEGDKVLRTERYVGALARSFQLPADIDQAAARAKYENGILILTLPKKQAGAAQRLNID
ncbi:Hsp20/alpha crystallin family protein [Ottowia sp. GY511]|uniref:Hsp20/alpha crystallin family protein n=1 Tax=Ottowia flava TaxID=2675430 RepID=A0ABW4KSU3_9BURK|nr:Hsp20/alpha crystallin family protein [Ottowia sp. GY511]TXK29746.1 Hsp20/alpha crystallin family protein [Ottowia sp. GY511]